MNFHAEPVDIDGHGRSVSDIGQDISEGTRKGRSLTLTLPGLTTGPAFESYRDAWLGQGDQISVNLNQDGDGTRKSGDAHEQNEQAITRGYNAINPK
ncbi:hypothetical protein [Stackebrandtia nassauensis]|uniref:Uncharacterized protein n=1 Tax=Stackebrandtia nassauensis (strain DSM 44728 / CIP 108903 / NRRL B-16338 / NBRC 102104 / LLR-40K-21) TaxID=446470 RepID=D3Q9Y6_STANL|nr:hypothetical protein [Stackebrandtia nassauensis]ADD40698.1 hypothetical protein Snas_0988 [Stackebrandtia nassauensis DSM 44728]